MVPASGKLNVATQARPPRPLPVAPVAPPRGPAGYLLALQRSHGNQAVQRLLKGSAAQRACACDGTCAHCRAEAVPQQRPISGILQHKRTGQALEPTLRAFMERGFGTDFDTVKIHTADEAATSAERLTAAADTVGQDIFFNRGQSQPLTQGGQRLLAHELAHVMQQQGGLPSPAPGREISEPGGPAEQVADRVADAIVAGQRPDELASSDGHQTTVTSPRLRIQRAVNEAKVGCRAGGIPALGISGPDAVAQITRANADAIVMSIDAQSRLFAERLAGPSDPNFAAILFEELGLDINNAADRAHMEIVERRFELMRRVLESDFTGHTCIGAAAVALGAGGPGACAGDCCTGAARACSCHGVSHIVLCRPWWTGDPHQQPGTLIHEAFHIYFGFINDFTNARLSDSHCYTGFVERLAGVTPVLSCAGRPH